MNTEQQENLIYRYLLGDLPEAEQLALEQAFFTDGETFEQVWEIENRMVDGYVRGGLTPRETKLFEQNYLTSPAHRERVAFARSLLQAVDLGAERGKALTSTPGSVSTWGSFIASLKGNSWRWAVVTALILLAVGSIWLVNERARLRDEIGRLQNQRAAEQQRAEELERQIARERQQSDQLAAEVERLHEETPGTEKALPALPTQPERQSIASFFLSPKMLMRSGGEPQPLKVAKEAALVRLQMNVEAPDTGNYQISLRTVEGKQVWSKTSIKARAQAKQRSTISVIIPASKFTTGDYILTLSAGDGATDPQEINRYFLRIIRQ